MIILIILIIVLLLILTYINNFLNYKKNYSDLTNKPNINYTNSVALMVEQADGTYIESTSSKWPDNMIFNSKLSKCVDIDGNIINNSMSYDYINKTVQVHVTKTAFCYVYFDKDNSIYAKVVSDYTSNLGVSKLSDSDKGDRTYDTYYYTGNITNNNVLYADHCWKMVITTENNGVKMIYNGTPNNGSCDNTGYNTTIGQVPFNSSDNSPAYVGYMYNSVYENDFKDIYEYTRFLTLSSKRLYNSSVNYYFGSDYTYSNGTYTLVNPTIYTWSNNYNNLEGYYTCMSETETSCTKLYYITTGYSFWIDYIEFNNGNDKIMLGSNYSDNGNGTYTLINPVELSIPNYLTTYSNYEGYYYCSDLKSVTCSTMYYANEVGSSGAFGSNIANNFKYGNTFTYDKNTKKYTLVDTVTIHDKDWKQKYNTLSKNHYTCFNTSGVCEEIYYIYWTTTSLVSYIKLTNGITIEDALNEMLYAENVNTTDSTIKAYIDDWYEENLLDETDSDGNLYSSYLQNTIYCANRKIDKLGGFDSNGGLTDDGTYFDYESLDCENKTDQFTLSVDNGGTKGYGNNALKYPIGLLTFKEAELAMGGIENNYLNISFGYALLSPYTLSDNNLYTGRVATSFIVEYNISSPYFGKVGWDRNVVRPVITLSHNVEIVDGDGSYDEPYRIKLRE